MSFAKAVCRTRNNPKTDSKSINFFCINCSGLLNMALLRNRKMQSHISYPLVKLFLFLLQSGQSGKAGSVDSRNRALRAGAAPRGKLAGCDETRGPALFPPSSRPLVD